MRRRKLIVKIAGICSIAALGLAVLIMMPTSALGQSVGAYGIQHYMTWGQEDNPRWQNDLPLVYNKLWQFLDLMSSYLGATTGFFMGSMVSRDNVSTHPDYGFDSFNMVYWQAHSHTLPFNQNVPKEDTGWTYDPENLLNWGTQTNPYLHGGSPYYNPSWHEYPCANNPGPGYTAAGYSGWRAVGMPMWEGYWGRFYGEAIVTRCDLSRFNGKGLGQNNNKWLILDSCDAVRVAHHTNYSSMDHGVIAWDQTFDGMHGVYGHYDSIFIDYIKAVLFVDYLNQGESIWEAYKNASNNPYTWEENKKTSAITAENQPRFLNCLPFLGCYWIYLNPSEMAINDHWYGRGPISDDIEAQDIEYFYTTYYIPD